MSLDRLLFDVDTALVGVANNAQRLLTVVTIVLPIFIVAFAILAILLVALLIVSIFLQFKRLRAEGNRRQRNQQRLETLLAAAEQQQQQQQRQADKPLGKEQCKMQSVPGHDPPAGIVASPIVFKQGLPPQQLASKEPTRPPATHIGTKQQRQSTTGTTAFEEQQQQQQWQIAPRTPLPIPVTVLTHASNSSEERQKKC